MTRMKHLLNRSRTAFYLGMALFTSCGAPQNPMDPVVQTTQLKGSVQKGPFVIGSTVNVSPTDDKGNPTGMVFNTKTTSDLGIFNLDVTASGLVSLEGNGFYYNEVTGDLSIAPITLRALYSLKSAGTQEAYINMVTHLTYDRVKNLIKSGMALAEAAKQAESELRLEIGLGSAEFDPGKLGTELNLLGGDNDANAYLFAVSAVVANAALIKAGSASGIDAKLQEILNGTSLDLSDDGQLSPLLKSELKAAQRTLDIDAVMRTFQGRLTALSSTVIVPDLNRVVDTDGDGIPNAKDNCRLVANPTQTPVSNAICGVANAIYENSADTPYSLAGVLTTGGDLGVVTFDRKSEYSFYLDFSDFLADAKGSLSAPIKNKLTLPGTTSADGSVDCRLADVNRDSAMDLLCYSSEPTSWFGTFFANGSGGFLAGQAINVGGDGSFYDIGVADFNKDGRPDVVGTQGGNLVFIAQQAGGTWAAPSAKGGFFASGIPVFYAGDVNKDGNPDWISLSNETALHNSVVSQALGDGAGGFTITSVKFTGEHRGAAFADFNGDGFIDLALTIKPAGSTQDRLEIVLGNPAGLPNTNVTVGSVAPAYVFGGDFTGDGKADILLKNSDATKSDSLVLGIWNGSMVTLGPKLSLYRNMNVDSVADLNKDGKLDLIGSVQFPKAGGGQTSAVATRLIF